MAAETHRAHQKPTKTPGDSNIRQHTVCDNNRKEGISIKLKVIGPNKKHRNTPPVNKQVSTTRPELYKTHSELQQYTKIKTHHYIDTAILRLYKLLLMSTTSTCSIAKHRY